MSFADFVKICSEMARDTRRSRFFITDGTGVPDDVAVQYFKNNPWVIVVTRDNKRWKGGVLVK